MKPVIMETSGLCVNYGRVEAIHKVDLRIREGEIVTVIGPNGAGKTTLLSALMGLLPARGEVKYQGHPTLLLGAFGRHRRGDRDHAKTMDEVFAIFPRLAERRKQEAGTLSGGERQMLAMGRALMAKPRLLMLDEPSLGLAPLIVKEILRIVVQLKGMGVSILLVEQNARAALQVADYGYVLENGAVAVENEAKSLLNDPRVIESYLGLGGSHSIAA
jgi:branched-chain amino acid transport system ATP-binding protein